MAALLLGELRLPDAHLVIRARYVVGMTPVWLYELLHGGRPGNGRGNRIYPTLRAFERDEGRQHIREDHSQIDYGVTWRTRGRAGRHRVTWIAGTGELIAVHGGRSGDLAVERIAVISNKQDVERCLHHFG